MNYITVTKKSDFPTKAHYAIMTFDTLYHEGDERSRTNPGHGYGAYTEEVAHYNAYLDKEEWLKEIKRLAKAYLGDRYSQTQWVAFEAGKPITIDIQVIVDTDYEREF
jgi:hypothetical protein